MLSLYTISSKPDAIIEQCKLVDPFSYSPLYQARPGMQLPIIIQKENKIELVMAQWGVKNPFVGVNRILSTRPYNILIRKQRCAAPANCFFSLKNGQPYLIRLLQHRLFLMGGIFHSAGGDLSFTLLQVQPADMLNTMMGQMPLVMAPEKLSSWLGGTEVGRVMHYADRAGSYWFDYFPVSKKILNTGNNKELLKPEGMSRYTLEAHEKKLLVLAYEKERANRSNLKY